MGKLVFAVRSETGVPALDADRLRSELVSAGATRLQLNVSDDAVVGALRIDEMVPPVVAVISVWTDPVVGEPSGPSVVEAVRRAVADIADVADTADIVGWSVSERVPLDPGLPDGGGRVEALANVAFLRRPPDLGYEEWRRRWLDDHTPVAIATQATFGYVQNIVDDVLTAETPHVDAIVEELFPTAAVHDMHAFYGSGGDHAELEDRMNRMLTSVSRFGADRHLDVVPTSRTDLRLT
ncbi:EthD domain-containing protein [Gordonia soli]|uniref:EthD domain-containing protein n=1 Tax=Gordonia soli NBRC 108243 TaxID=1223545 RepID=M0QCH1_9ACTN|nr:EthD domain-containing protein [Gordonia soli]GAC66260.1 hypothetical protein GS4_01_00620 [Gordonia soli NBRC 108243]